MTTKNKGGAPLGNQNNRKDPEDAHAGTLYVKCKPGEKFLWRYASWLFGGKLADWVRTELNASAMRLIKSKNKLPDFERENLRRIVGQKEGEK